MVEGGERMRVWIARGMQAGVLLGGVGAAVACGSSGAAPSPDASAPIDGSVANEAAALDAVTSDAPDDSGTAADSADSTPANDRDAPATDDAAEGSAPLGCAPPLSAPLRAAPAGPPNASAYFAIDTGGDSCFVKSGTASAPGATLQFQWSTPNALGTIQVPSGSPWHMISVSDGMLLSGVDATIVSGDKDITIALADASGASLLLTFRIDTATVRLVVSAVSLVGSDAATDAAEQ